MDYLCRICVEIAVKDNFKPIENENEDLIKRLKTFIDLEEHKEYSNICYTCLYELDIAFDFVNKCASATEKLKNYILNKGNTELTHIEDLAQESIVFNSNNADKFIFIKEEDYADIDEAIFAEPISEYSSDNCTDIKSHESLVDNFKSSRENENYEHRCDECARLFVTQQALKAHRKLEHKKTYKCDQCSREFKHSGLLKSHQQSHQIFSCSECSRQFTTKNRLMRHTRIHSNDKYSFNCTVCLKKFTVACNLTRHMMIHEGIKPFVCETCGKTFSQKVVLQTHMKTHERLTKAIEDNLTDGTTCNLCQCSFENTKCLFSHLTRHHGNAYNKKILVKFYQCDECGKCLKGYKTWKLHQGTHTGLKPFTCDLCGKSFRLRELMKRHRRVHTGEKPYQCVKCPMKFGVHANLIKHVRKHTGDKPFKCKHCEMSFTSSFNMRRHAARHERNKPAKNS